MSAVTDRTLVREDNETSTWLVMNAQRLLDIPPSVGDGPAWVASSVETLARTVRDATPTTTTHLAHVPPVPWPWVVDASASVDNAKEEGGGGGGVKLPAVFWAEALRLVITTLAAVRCGHL